MQAADGRSGLVQLERADDARNAEDLAQAEHKRHGKRYQHALAKAPGDAVGALRAHILAREGRHGVLHAENRDHQNVLHPGGDGIGRDHSLAVEIDQPLQKQKAAGDDGLLNGHRRADLQNAARRFHVQPQLAEREAQKGVFPVHICKADDAGGDLRNNGGDGRACHAQPKPRDKRKVEHDVQNRRDEQKIQRRLAVAQRPQKGRRDVVPELEHQSRRVDAEIQKRHRQQRLRRAQHSFQQESRAHNAGKRHE